MKIRITMNIDPDYADPDHPMGVTESGYDAMLDVLGQFGTDVEVQAEGYDAQ